MKIHYLMGARVPLYLDHQACEWDIFVSAYNESDRVRVTFDRVKAQRKVWVLLPEYGYSSDETVSLADPIRCDPEDTESDVIRRLVNGIGLDALTSAKLCVDITGFMRPQILFLMRFFFDLGIANFFFCYSEPERYARQEHTTFSKEEIVSVRQVQGYEGIHSDEIDTDILIVGVGYDDALISRVVNDKERAKLLLMLSLPSLSADMYQESVLRLDRTGSNADMSIDNRIIFAPANDPFVVASEISDTLDDLYSVGAPTNVYLCSLATKPQAVGFGLVYLRELLDRPVSIVFPFARSYERETSKGMGRTWLYHIEL